MNSERFELLVEERIEKIRKVLIEKGKEYSNNSNKLIVFDRGAYKSGKTREEVLNNFRFKHELSLDVIREDVQRNKLPSLKTIDDKIGDIINYYILEEACYIDRIEKQAEVKDIRV